jgi:hypothetical protein
VKLSVGGRELTQPLTVRKDPHSAGTEADIQAQMKVLVELRGDMERAADLVSQIELVRSQIDGLARVLEDAAIKKTGDDFNEKLIALEQNVLDLRLTGRLARAASEPTLMSKIAYLASELASADFKPTSQQLEVQKLLEERVTSYRDQLDKLLSRDLDAFNGLLRISHDTRGRTNSDQPQ